MFQLRRRGERREACLYEYAMSCLQRTIERQQRRQERYGQVSESRQERGIREESEARQRLHLSFFP